MKIKYTTILLLLISSVSFANDDLQAIRDEISAMKKQYEQKIANLEARLQAAEDKIKQQNLQQYQDIQSTNETVEQQDIVADTPETNNPYTFNPAISLIFDGSYVD